MSDEPEGEFERAQLEWITNEDGGYVGVVYEEPLRGGWYVAAAFLFTDAGLTLVELKVFPGGYREDRYSRGYIPNPSPGEWSISKIEHRNYQGRIRLTWPAEADEQLDIDMKDVDVGGITTRLLRDVRVRELVDKVHRSFVHLSDRDSDPVAEMFLEVPMDRPGRAGRDDRFYASWASRLEHHIRTGSKQPYIDLADELDVRRERVRDVIYEARRRGLFSGGGKTGQRGVGALTDKGRAALAEED